MKRNRKANKIYTLTIKSYEGDTYEPRFAFHAVDEQDALSKAREWAFYHSFNNETISVREPTENEATNWLHDEYIF